MLLRTFGIVDIHSLQHSNGKETKNKNETLKRIKCWNGHQSEAETQKSTFLPFFPPKIQKW